MVFIDLERAYDRMPKEILKWYMYLVQALIAKSKCAITEDFSARVGVYQGYALSPYLVLCSNG